MKRIMVSCLVLGGMLASAASAQDGPPAGSGDKPAKERKICRRSASLGSSIPKSVCKTKAEWAEADTREKTDAQGTIDRLNSNPR